MGILGKFFFFYLFLQTPIEVGNSINLILPTYLQNVFLMETEAMHNSMKSFQDNIQFSLFN